MPAGACPVPVNGDTGKREVGGYELFYYGWKQDNPTQENCRFGVAQDILFSPDKTGSIGLNISENNGIDKTEDA